MLDKISRPLSVEVPTADTLDAYLDEIVPKIRRWSEDLWEQKNYLSKPWLEVRDDVTFHHSVLHFFNEDDEYLQSVDGNVGSGSWRYLEKANKFLISEGRSDGELYDLAFLDDQFFILMKHGNQKRMGKRKYFVMVHEPVAKRLEWREAMDMLFNKYRNSSSFYITIAIIVLLIIAIFVVLS